MGGRGASSGMSDSGKRYGTEFRTIAQDGEVKYVKYNGNNVTAPMETMHFGRIYATLDKDNDVKHITFYDSNGERTKQIDLKGKAHNGLLPHVHIGYEHNEIGDRDLNEKERKTVEKILNTWEKRRKKLNL